MVQLNSVPVFGAKKIPVPFDGNFPPKFSCKWEVLQIMHQCEIASCIVRSTCSHVMSHHLSYISYRQLANGPIRAASGAIVCWRSSFLFMYKDTGCPLIRDINMITLHCIAMRCITWDDVNLNCMERRSLTSQKFKFLKLCDWQHVQREQVRRKKPPCQKSGY